MEAKTVVIVDAVRSAFGRGARGSLVSTRMDEVAATVVKTLLERNPKVDPYEIEDVACGNVGNNGELMGMTSATVNRVAGLPPEVSHVTVNRQCGSSMQALHMIASAIMAGSGDIGIAMGVERMGRGLGGGKAGEDPITRPNPKMLALQPNQKRPDPHHNDYFKVPFQPYLVDSPANPSMLQTAQNVAEAWNLSREELDRFALESHVKADNAYKAGYYKNQIVPLNIRLPVMNADGTPDYNQQGAEAVFERDECIRVSSLEKLGALETVKGYVSYGERQLLITAGNSSPTNDGAAAVLLMSEEKAKALGLKPMARIKAMSVAGVKPQLMGVGTIPASYKAIKRAGLKAKDIGLADINEAFASQSIATVRDLGLDQNVVNVNGGAIALGHPLGASGARLFVSLCHEMQRRGNVKYGLSTMCIGAGMGIATVVEAVN
jgi:acetyl-CoA acetyltransferase family protein